MPNTKSAKKRWRKSLEQRDRNRAEKAKLRTIIRKAREAVRDGKLDDAQAIVRESGRMLDQAAAKGILHTKQSSRLQSRLSHMIGSAKSKAAS